MRETRGITMKKVLFATSALVAFAGAASAEVAVTGDARIGMLFDSAAPYCNTDLAAECSVGDDGSWTFNDTRGAWNVVHRARVHFTMTGESDAGLSFGASFRADQASAARTGLNSMSGSAGKVWVSGVYGKLSVGDVDGAAEMAVGDLAEVGLTGLRYFNETTYLTSDLDGETDTNLLYEYSINGVNLYASFQDGYIGMTGEKNEATGWALGASYDMAGYKVGIGYEKADAFYIEDSAQRTHFTSALTGAGRKSSSLSLSASTTFNDVTVKGLYSTTKIDEALLGGDDAKFDQYGLSAEYTMANGVGLAGFYKNSKLEDNKLDAIGMGASYDIGGGATVKGGLVSYKFSAPGEDNDREMLADFGLSFKF